MSEPITYEIRTVEDFLAVPVERLDVCLMEFATWLGVRHLAGTLEQLIGARTHPSSIGVFAWTDDGKGEIRINVHGPGGEPVHIGTLPTGTAGK